ncbi:hypothetical protein BB559_006902 [Furculomyces boomerangus]|uniref:Uncharacterized protein n=2 Tax=Harpellales TaxID=61421 RepID=A0A2T9XZZ2_9FUNG|nr:hypothetical protein BB559_006902 [Furculomyces boomerangus]PWA01041.1 hypothetical protein BB558_002881 [Smittium angustum]
MKFFIFLGFFLSLKSAVYCINNLYKKALNDREIEQVSSAVLDTLNSGKGLRFAYKRKLGNCLYCDIQVFRCLDIKKKEIVKRHISEFLRGEADNWIDNPAGINRNRYKRSPGNNKINIDLNPNPKRINPDVGEGISHVHLGSEDIQVNAQQTDKNLCDKYDAQPS